MVDSTMPEVELNKVPVKKKSIIPYYFFAFFAVIITVNGIMLYFALSSWTGLETKNHYVKGLSYNENLDGAAQMKALGWQETLNIIPESGLIANLVLIVNDNAGRAIEGAKVHVIAIRPTHHGYDQKIALQEVSPGQYEGNIEFPLLGQWDLKKLIVANNGSYQSVKRIHIDEKGFH